MYSAKDTPAQRRVLRVNRVALKVRQLFPEGTRVVSTRGPGAEPTRDAPRGTVLRHVPGMNSQGGHVVVAWDSGSVGRHSACSLAREDGKR